MNMRLLLSVLSLIVVVAGYFTWSSAQAPDLPEGLASGNGRIEATEIDIAALTGGRIADITAVEGDFAPFHRLLHVLSRPYEDQPEAADLTRPPEPHEVVRATFCGT